MENIPESIDRTKYDQELITSISDGNELEIDFKEMKKEEKIGKGGFSIVYKGKWKGQTVH